LGDPPGSNATAGLALRVTGSHKPLHHDKVWIPSGGGGIYLENVNNEVYCLINVISWVVIFFKFAAVNAFCFGGGGGVL